MEEPELMRDSNVRKCARSTQNAAACSVSSIAVRNQRSGKCSDNSLDSCICLQLRQFAWPKVALILTTPFEKDGFDVMA